MSVHPNVTMHLHRNDHKKSYRFLLDALPHDLRRAAVRVLRPELYRHLMEMRGPEAKHPRADLSEFVRRRALFVHVPKAAGSSVRESLFGGRTPSHMTMHYFMIAFSRAEFDSMFKFAFVRNPWDRVYSAWRFMQAGGGNREDAMQAQRCLSQFRDFEDFILRGIGTPPVAEVIHFSPQTDFVELCPGRMPLDFIGYFEQFEQDYLYIASRMGVQLDEVPWENKTKGKRSDYRDAYTPAMIEKVAEIYRRDVELFGYDFDSYKPIALNNTQ